MISIIFSVIIKIFFFLINSIFTLILSFFPELPVSGFTTAMSLFFGFCEQSLNFLYFVSGGTIFIFIDIWFALFVTKHIVIPIVNFTRKAIFDLF